MFGNTQFNIEYHILIKILHLIKEYITQKLLKEYPSNSWNKRSFQRLLKSKDSGSVDIHTYVCTYVRTYVRTYIYIYIFVYIKKLSTAT